MAKSQMQFSQNTELGMQVASVGINWFRQVAEHNFNQSREPLGELFKVNRRVVDIFNDQASAFCEHSMSLAAEMLSNTLDCAVKLLSPKEPQEMAQIQTDFVSRQAQAIADQNKELNEHFMKGAKALASSLSEAAQRQAMVA
jgi:hypothetical protein